MGIWGIARHPTPENYIREFVLQTPPILTEERPRLLAGRTISTDGQASELHETGGEGNILQPPTPVVSAAIAHKTFGPADLTRTYSMCTRRVFGGFGHRTSPSFVSSM
ncbi:hypothetical protein TNCV_4481881 [Trichonephila clavipes]|nr:hypothetical protein TNCV_4481881 [Trichonephila clavipes]